MRKGQLLILLIFCICDSSRCLEALYDTGKELCKLYWLIDKMTVNNSQHTKEVYELFSGKNGRNHEIKNQIDKIDEQLEAMEESMNPKIIRDSLKFLLSDIVLHKHIDVLDLFIPSIDEAYKTFRRYTDDESSYSHHILNHLVREITLRIEGKMELIQMIVTEANECQRNHTNLLFSIAVHSVTLYAKLCNGLQTISYIINQLFRMVMIAELKVHIMLVFTNTYRYSKDEGWKTLNSLARDKFEVQFGIYVNSFALTLDITDSLWLRSCDPENGIWNRNEHFYELEGTFQTTIFRYHWFVCNYDSCNDVWFRKHKKCDSQFYDRRTTCSGTSAECAYLSTIQACALKSGPHKFQYVNSTQLGPLGRNFECPKDNGYLIQDGTGWNSTYATCACNCYSSRNKISLLIMESHVISNKVITGLRFFRENEILYIQPREGVLKANGHIPRHTERWIPIPNSEKSQIGSVNQKNRVFFLDDIRLPHNYALTGIKFNRVTRGTIRGFAIEIFGVPFDYKSGKLNLTREYRKSRKASNEDPGHNLPFNAISSVHTVQLHTPNPASAKYVSLQRSKLSDDFGQSTLPFFDAVPILSHFPSVIGGIGIFHKGADGYAGFISLRAYGIRYQKHFIDFEIMHMKNGRIVFDNSTLT